MKKLELEQECIYGIIGAYNLLLKNLEKVFKPYGVSASKFNILMVIKHQAQEDGISQTDIGSKLIIGEANIAKIANKLYEEGYITRQTNPNDRRYNLLKITKKGSDLLDKVWPKYLQSVEKLTEKLDKNEKELLIKITKNWTEFLKKKGLKESD